MSTVDQSDTTAEEFGERSPSVYLSSSIADEEQGRCGTEEGFPSPSNSTPYLYKPGSPHASLDSDTPEGQSRKGLVVRTEHQVKEAMKNADNTGALLTATEAMLKSIIENAHEAKRQRAELRAVGEQVQALQRTMNDVLLRLENPEFIAQMLNLRKLSEATLDAMAAGFRAIWGPRVYPPHIFFTDGQGGESKTCNYMVFVKTVYAHYERIFNNKSPLQKYFINPTEETRSVRHIGSLRPRQEDYTRIDLRRVHNDEIRTKQFLEMKAAAVQERKAAELRAARMTYSAFADYFIIGYEQAEQHLEEAGKELIPNTLKDQILPEELAEGVQGILKAHKRFTDLCQQILAEAAAEQKSSSDTSSHETGGKTSRFVDALARAFPVPWKSKGKKERKLQTAVNKFSAETGLKQLDEKRSKYDDCLKTYQTIGLATAILFDDRLFELFIDPNNELRAWTNQFVHGSVIKPSELKEAVIKAKDLFPQVSDSTLVSLKYLYDVAFALGPADRFDAHKDFKSIMNDVKWPLADKGNTRFVDAPGFASKKSTGTSQPSTSKARPQQASAIATSTRASSITGTSTSKSSVPGTPDRQTFPVSIGGGTGGRVPSTSAPTSSSRASYASRVRVPKPGNTE